MRTDLRILHLEDSSVDAEIVQAALAAEGISCETVRVETRADFVAELEGGGFDVILADYKPAKFDGVSALAIAKETSPYVPFIFVSGWLSEETAIQTVKSGATDLVFKNRMSRFVPSVRRALDEARERAERKRAEEALRNSEERFRAMSTCSPVGILLTDIEGRCSYTNPRCQSIFGCTFDEMLGEGWLRFVYLEDRQRGFEEWVASACEARKSSREFRLQARQGMVRWLNVRSSPVFSDEGTLIGRVGIVEDITERERADQARLELLGRLIAVQEGERRRIARELHDQTAQNLTSIVLALESLEDDSRYPLVGHAKVSELRRLADQIIEDLHNLAWELRPPALDDFGLQCVLQQYTEQWSLRHGLPVDFLSSGLDSNRLPPQVETTIYRVVQEALTNVLKHANAQRVGVLVEAHPDRVITIVEDDGKGFDTEAAMNATDPRQKLGLLGMQERVALVRGTLNIESAPGAGTTVFARIPLAT